ncbi:MAG TPA: division/cell wall cluster transcriptional repressor MraZ [Methylomirabilota bacterium]|nr:division/cell wall cluster transcriptional repressor MraZ [Methylomirabilota bacterium]
MFRGRYFHAVDPKGRLSIPAKFREVLKERYGATLVVASFDDCLVAYPLKEWTKLEEKLLQLPSTQLEVRKFLRRFFSSGVECEVDSHGRVLLQPQSREFAAITREAVLLGAMNRFEIWGRERWDDFMRRSEGTFEETAEKLSALGV